MKLDQIDTLPEILELGLSVLVALLAVYAMQRVQGAGLTSRQICAGRAALMLLAFGAGLSGVRPIFELASPQILILVPLLIVLAWVAAIPLGGSPCRRDPDSTSSSRSSRGSA